MTLYRRIDSKSLFSHSFLIALLWGSLWGFTEATLGHILHLLRIPGLAGFVMFPIGVFFMVKAYQISGKLNVILVTSMVAATIKLTNILFPGTSFLDVLRPTIAIVCESLVVFVLIVFVKIIFVSTHFNIFDVKSGIHAPSTRIDERSAF
jgi:hypothetical protein